MSDFQTKPVSFQPTGASQGQHVDPAKPSGIGQLDLSAAIEEAGLANFNERAGVNRHRQRATEHLPLQQRRLQPPTRRPATAGSGHSAEAGNEALHTAAASALQALQNGGKSSLEEQFEKAYDVLEQHTLLRSARAQAEQSDLSPTEKDQLRNDLNDMMADLMDRHGDVIRAGLKNAAAFEGAVDAMDTLSQANSEAHQPDSVRELRSQFGAKGDARMDAPLTPFELAASLQNKFGADNFSAALGDLRSKMAAEFRSNPASAPGPRLWLSLSDAVAFNAVQSSFAIAGDLRRDLSERAGLTPALHQAGTSLVLLNAAQSGAGSADAIVQRLVGEQHIGNLAKVQMYMAMRHAINQMPTGIWSSELLPQRSNLLDHLRNLAIETTGQMLPQNVEELDTAHALRQRVQRKSKRDKDDRGDERGHDDEGDHQDNGEQLNPMTER